jgi:hypothetical protein
MQYAIPLLLRAIRLERLDLLLDLLVLGEEGEDLPDVVEVLLTGTLEEFEEALSHFPVAGQ